MPVIFARSISNLMLRGILSRYPTSSQFFFFIGIFWLSGFFFQRIGLFLSFPILGTNDMEAVLEVLTNPSEQDIADAGARFAMKLVNIMYAIGMLLGGLLFVYLTSGAKIADLGKNRPAVLPVLLITVSLFALEPIVVLMAEWNAAMIPAGEAKDAMLEFSDQYSRLTRAMLVQGSLTDNLTTLLMLAVLAPIWEELIYRGLMQRLLHAMSGNIHIAIWTAAILFSVFHLDFMNLLPRMLLGAFFGYLYYWSRNIWVPILGHMINNATFVILSWSTGVDPTESAVPMDPVLAAAIGAGILAISLVVFRRYASAPELEPPPRTLITLKDPGSPEDQDDRGENR